MFPIFFSEISGMFPTVLTFLEKFASLGMNDGCTSKVGLTRVEMELALLGLMSAFSRLKVLVIFQ